MKQGPSRRGMYVVMMAGSLVKHMAAYVTSSRAERHHRRSEGELHQK